MQNESGNEEELPHGAEQIIDEHHHVSESMPDATSNDLDVNSNETNVQSDQTRNEEVVVHTESNSDEQPSESNPTTVNIELPLISNENNDIIDSDRVCRRVITTGRKVIPIHVYVLLGTRNKRRTLPSTCQ